MAFHRILPPGPTTSIGNAGEHFVMAVLLAEGFNAFMADRGNPAFDIAVECDGKLSLLRVKTVTRGSIQWSVKKDGTLFTDMRDSGDFVAIVDARIQMRSAPIYLIPTIDVDRELHRVTAIWYSSPRRNGQPRKQTSARRIRFEGSPDSLGAGYSEHWAAYREAWHLLKPAIDLSAATRGSIRSLASKPPEGAGYQIVE